MKKNKILVVIVAVFLLLASGCTRYMSDSNHKRVVNEVTGQALTSNILCLPSDKALLKKYEKNKSYLDVDYKKLKPCKDFKLNQVKYNSLWESVFVKPLAYILIKTGNLVKNYGLSVVIIGAIIRLILLPFTKKSLMQSENMKKANPEIQRIQKKYGNSKDQAAAMQMSSEMMAVYKKYDINPASGCIIALIQLPILFAFLEAINRVPAIFEDSFLTLQLGTTPSFGIKSGNLLYIVLVLLIILTTYFSYKYSMNTTTGNEEQDKQMGMMMKFMIIFISIASLSLPTALALYWIISNFLTIVQNIFIRGKLNKNEIKVVIKDKKEKTNKKKGK